MGGNPAYKALGHNPRENDVVCTSFMCIGSHLTLCQYQHHYQGVECILPLGPNDSWTKAHCWTSDVCQAQLLLCPVKSFLHRCEQSRGLESSTRLPDPWVELISNFSRCFSGPWEDCGHLWDLHSYKKLQYPPSISNKNQRLLRKSHEWNNWLPWYLMPGCLKIPFPSILANQRSCCDCLSTILNSKSKKPTEWGSHRGKPEHQCVVYEVEGQKRCQTMISQSACSRGCITRGK